MVHGSVVYFSEDQIRIPEHLLASIFISPGSVVHCMRYLPMPDQRVRHKADLLLTPINPDYWPFMARFTMQVAHQKGAMYNILQAFSDHFKEKGVETNILFTRSTRSGHEHGSWTLYCVFESIRKKYEKQIKTFKADVEEKKVIDKYNDFIPILKDIADDIRKIIYGPYDSNKTIWQRTPTPNEQAAGFIGYIEEKGDNYIWKNFEQWIGVRAITVDYLSSLSNYFLRRVFFRKVPTLRAEPGSIPFPIGENESIFDELSRHVGMPTIGVASVDTGDCTMRVNVIERTKANKFYQINVRYARTKSSYDDGAYKNPNHTSSRNLLRNISSALCDHNMSIWNMSNMMSDDRVNYEKGRISLITEKMEDKDSHEVEKEIKHLQDHIVQKATRTFSTMSDIQVSINQLGRDIKIFLAMKIPVEADYVTYVPNAQKMLTKAINRRNMILDLIYKVGSKYSFSKNNFNVLEVSSKNITDEVVYKVRQSDAMIQVFIDHAKEDTPVFGRWFDAEFLLAKSRGIEPIRIVEKSIGEGRYNNNTVIKDIVPIYCEYPTLKQGKELEIDAAWSDRSQIGLVDILEQQFENIWTDIRGGKTRRWRMY